MIKSELYITRSDGVNLYRTYSDKNVCISNEGNIYEEAIDPEGANRTYTETDIPIQVEQLSPEEALAIITGGEM